MDNEGMLEVLSAAIAKLPSLMERDDDWSSLIINRRKPWTYRAFTTYPFEGQMIRISLHRFATCEEHESFLHPHPWPGAFAILKGSYLMNVGYTPDRFSSKPKNVTKLVLPPGSRYAITNPLTWHSVTPLEECYTVMVNGEPWDPQTVANVNVRTTKGKDLDSMTTRDLSDHFATFRKLLDLMKKEKTA